MRLRPDVQRDFDWQRRFIPEMKRIVGEHLIGEAPAEEDAKRNTDLIVLRLEAVRIACRVRNHRYLASYRDEFTIRSHRDTGAKTELAKIREGWGDYLLYGFADSKNRLLSAWVLGDLAVFREWLSADDCGSVCCNGDGTAFHAYRIANLPSEFVVARRRYLTLDDILPPRSRVGVAA